MSGWAEFEDDAVVRDEWERQDREHDRELDGVVERASGQRTDAPGASGVASFVAGFSHPVTVPPPAEQLIRASDPLPFENDEYPRGNS